MTKKGVCGYPPQDLEALVDGSRIYSRWYDSRASDEMLKATDTAWATWCVVRSEDETRAHLNVTTHLLGKIPHETVRRDEVKLPRRQEVHSNREPDYPFNFIREKL